jgi:hypothetical protein
MMLLTLVVDGHPAGLLYGDYDEPRPQSPFDSARDPVIRAWRELLQEVLRAQGSKG